MNYHPLSLNNRIKGVLLVLIVSFVIPLQAFSGGKDDPREETLDFKIQNMALRSMNEAIQSLSEISASYSAPYFNAKYAADGKAVTAWSNFLYYRSSDFLEVDFGEEIRVSNVMVQNYVDMNAGMDAFDLQYYNGSAWVTFGRFTTSIVNGEQIEIDLPEIKASAVRITNFSVDSAKNCVGVAEFEVNAPKMTSSIDTSEAQAAYAHDGLRETLWSNCFLPLASDFLELDLGRVVIVTQVRIINGVDETIGASSFDLEYHNGLTWQKIGNYSTKLTDGEVIDISVPSIYAKALRIKNFKNGLGKTCVGIAEFQVNGPAMDSDASPEASHPVIDAGDESTESYWLNCDDFEETGAIEVDLGKSFPVSRITVTNYYPETGNAGALEFDIEYLNGTTWVRFGERQKGALTHQSFFNIALSSPVNAQYFRVINFETGAGRTCVGLNDVSFFTPDRMPYLTMPAINVEILPVLDSISLTPEETGTDNSEDRDIVLSGENFIGEPEANTIYFESDGNPAFTIKNTGGTETELLATIPKDAKAGTYNVYVVNEYGTSNILEDEWVIGNAGVDRESNDGSSSDKFGMCFISSIDSTSSYGLQGGVLLLAALVSILILQSGKKRSAP